MTAGWENFFVAEVGAAAALSGLLFVAVSINLSRILQLATLPERALESLLVLLSVVAVATFRTCPESGERCFGAEVVAGLGIFVWSAAVRTQWSSFRIREMREYLPSRVISTQLATLPFIGAGILIGTGHASGNVLARSRDDFFFWRGCAQRLGFAGGDSALSGA